MYSLTPMTCASPHNSRLAMRLTCPGSGPATANKWVGEVAFRRPVNPNHAFFAPHVRSCSSDGVISVYAEPSGSSRLPHHFAMTVFQVGLVLGVEVGASPRSRALSSSSVPGAITDSAEKGVGSGARGEGCGNRGGKTRGSSSALSPCCRPSLVPPARRHEAIVHHRYVPVIDVSLLCLCAQNFFQSRLWLVPLGSRSLLSSREVVQEVLCRVLLRESELMQTRSLFQELKVSDLLGGVLEWRGACRF